MKIKRSVEILSSTLLILSILAGCSSSKPMMEIDYCEQLTQGKLSESEVGSILGADTSYISCNIVDSEYVRMMVAENNPIYMVPTENYLNYSKYSIKNMTKVLNDIFTIINPEIKFVYQESMPQANSNLIVFDIDDEMDSLGRTSYRKYDIKDDELYSKYILIRVNTKLWPKAVEQGVKYETLLSHEVGHALGLSHKNENTTAQSVMINTGECGINGYFTLNDMYLFAALYGGYSTKAEVLYVKDLIDNYYENIKADNYAQQNLQENLLQK